MGGTQRLPNSCKVTRTYVFRSPATRRGAAHEDLPHHAGDGAGALVAAHRAAKKHAAGLGATLRMPNSIAAAACTSPIYSRHRRTHTHTHLQRWTHGINMACVDTWRARELAQGVASWRSPFGACAGGTTACMNLKTGTFPGPFWPPCGTRSEFFGLDRSLPFHCPRMFGSPKLGGPLSLMQPVLASCQWTHAGALEPKG